MELNNKFMMNYTLLIPGWKHTTTCKSRQTNLDASSIKLLWQWCSHQMLPCSHRSEQLKHGWCISTLGMSQSTPGLSLLPALVIMLHSSLQWVNSFHGCPVILISTILAPRHDHQLHRQYCIVHKIRSTHPTNTLLSRTYAHCLGHTSQQRVFYEHRIILQCADGIFHQLYPQIFTYSADYPKK